MMSAGITADTRDAAAPTRDGIVAELHRLRACAAQQGMDALRDLLDAVAEEMMAPAKG